MSAKNSFGNKLRQWVAGVIEDEVDLTQKSRLTLDEQERRLLRTSENDLVCRIRHKAPDANVFVYAQGRASFPDLISYQDAAVVQVKWFGTKTTQGQRHHLSDWKSLVGLSQPNWKVVMDEPGQCQYTQYNVIFFPQAAPGLNKKIKRPVNCRRFNEGCSIAPRCPSVWAPFAQVVQPKKLGVQTRLEYMPADDIESKALIQVHNGTKDVCVRSDLFGNPYHNLIWALVQEVVPSCNGPEMSQSSKGSGYKVIEIQQETSDVKSEYRGNRDSKS